MFLDKRRKSEQSGFVLERRLTSEGGSADVDKLCTSEIWISVHSN